MNKKQTIAFLISFLLLMLIPEINLMAQTKSEKLTGMLNLMSNQYSGYLALGLNAYCVFILNRQYLFQYGNLLKGTREIKSAFFAFLIGFFSIMAFAKTSAHYHFTLSLKSVDFGLAKMVVANPVQFMAFLHLPMFIASLLLLKGKAKAEVVIPHELHDDYLKTKQNPA